MARSGSSGSKFGDRIGEYGDDWLSSAYRDASDFSPAWNLSFSIADTWRSPSRVDDGASARRSSGEGDVRPNVQTASGHGGAPDGWDDVIFLGDGGGFDLAGGSGGGGAPISGGSSVLSSYTSGAAGAYNITISFKGTWTTDAQNVFIASANRLSAIVVGDIPAVRIKNTTIDDIVITAELKAIDGVGGVLGQAGPTAVRSGSYLPATAAMQFDSADAANYLSQGLFDEIVTHEMLHSIGVGSIWGYLGLTSGMYFIGSNAVNAYNALVDDFSATHGGSNTLANGSVVQKGFLPLETGGGSGTAGSHWSEAVFANELMTGYLNVGAAGSTAPPDPLSAMTAASLRDLGYVVSASPPVDPYALR